MSLRDQSAGGVEGKLDGMEKQDTAASAAVSRRAKSTSAVGAKKRAGSTSKRAKQREIADSPAGKNAAAVGGSEAEDAQTPISRKALLEKALRTVATDLKAGGKKRPTNTIGNLVQLLKLDRSFREDEEQPHEIRVVWEEKRDETVDDLPERRSEASPKA